QQRHDPLEVETLDSVATGCDDNEVANRGVALDLDGDKARRRLVQPSNRFGGQPDLAPDLEPAHALVTQQTPGRRDLPPKLRREPPSAPALASRQRGAQFPNLGLHRALLAKGPSLARDAPGVRTGYGEALRCVEAIETHPLSFAPAAEGEDRTAVGLSCVGVRNPRREEFQGRLRGALAGIGDTAGSTIETPAAPCTVTVSAVGGAGTAACRS